MIDLLGLQKFLSQTSLSDWSKQLPHFLAPVLEEGHGDLERWQNALQSFPTMEKSTLDLITECGISGACDEALLFQALKSLVPWRKGPFRFSKTLVDTEWRSDFKWQRIAPHIDLNNKRVLDVGCGNGYYGFRMLGAGARFVLGIDPNWLFLHQFLAFKQYAKDLPIWQLPWALEQLTPNLQWFDYVFSMGVLYHRKAPFEHFSQLKDALNPEGTLVLETLVVDGDAQTVLVPKDRYAQMRNVWFLPSIAALTLWLERAGFKNIRCVDVSYTTVEEQRRTEWMPYQSLSDFLDPADCSKTIEGYPAPQRVVLLANN